MLQVSFTKGSMQSFVQHANNMVLPFVRDIRGVLFVQR